MELNLQYEELKCCSCVLDTVARREDTQEAIVTDSMPDIGTVLSVTATPLLRTLQAEDGAVSCDVLAQAAVLYEAERDGSLCSIPVNVPIRCSVESPKVRRDSRLNAVVNLCSAEVKVMNPRKVLVQISVTVRLWAFAEETRSYSTDVRNPEPGLQLRRETRTMQFIASASERVFPFEEQISLSTGRQTAAQLLKCDVMPYCSETKLVGTKVVFKGGLKTRLRLKTEEGALRFEEYDLPMSQVLDAGAAGDQASAMVFVSLREMEAEMLDRDTVALRCECYACCTVFDRRDVTLLADAYSTAQSCACTLQNVDSLELAGLGIRMVPIRKVLDLEVNASELIEQSVTLSEVSSDQSGAKSVRARLKLSCVFRDRDGSVSRVDQSCYVDCEVPDFGEVPVSVELQLLEAAGLFAPGGLELRGTLLVQYAAMETQSAQCLSGISLDALPSEAHRPSAVLRMLKAGETLWDLGKQYFATVEDILAVNQISGESEAAGKFLLIPRDR